MRQNYYYDSSPTNKKVIYYLIPNTLTKI